MISVVSLFLVLAISAGQTGAFSLNIRQRYTAKSSLTMMASRKPFIAGNWKMNTDLESAIALARDVAELTKSVCETRPYIVQLEIHSNFDS
jgi:hypothetical protein